MVESGTELCLSRAQYSVYSCILYFHVFRYPAKVEEIAGFVSMPFSREELNEALSELVEMGLVFTQEGFYYPERSIEPGILKRKNSERRLLEKKQRIRRYAAFISAFPFVRSVCISGSCSKGLFDAESDVDYFIITAPGKLWLCRTILIAFKKIFLLNSKKYFCVNYFVDADNLEIPDRNLFVAYEIKTLAPVSNFPLFADFMTANGWTRTYLPNKNEFNDAFLLTGKSRRYLSGLVESVLNNGLGRLAEDFCFKLTLSTWKKRYPGFNKAEFELNFRSRRNVSKHHPRGFQMKVLQELNRKLERVKVSD